MTPEEIKAAEAALLTKIKSEIADQVAEAKKGTVDKAAFDALETKYNAIVEKSKATEGVDMKVLIEEHKQFGLEIIAMKEKPAEVKGKSFVDALKEAFETKKGEIAKALEGNQSTPIRLTVKTVGAMSVESTIGAGSTQNTITQNTGIISTIRKREFTYLANVSVGSIAGNRAVWVEETDEEGTPIMLGEGDAKTQLDVQYAEQTMSVKKIAVYGKVTTELMADIPQLIAYIQNNLQKRMDIVLENQLFSGLGTGDTLKGVITYATAFAASGNSVEDANELDVIETVALQTKLAFGIPNVIFIHPSTMSKIKLIKDSTGRPVWKDYVTITGDMVISGMRVIETTAITAGDFVGGDFSVVNVLEREGLTIQIGLDGNDFTQNKKTMLLERRLTQFVSGNDVGVLVTGTFTTAIAAIAPVAP